MLKNKETHTFSAASSLAAFKSRRTVTVDHVIHHCTFSWLYTRVGNRAGVNTVVVVAGLLCRTVKIRSAINFKTGYVRIALKSRWT